MLWKRDNTMLAALKVAAEKCIYATNNTQNFLKNTCNFEVFEL